MKAIFSLAAVLVILSSPAMSQNDIDRSSNYNEAGKGGAIAVGQDNLSFAKAVRRKVKRPACSPGVCQYWQTCCPRYNSDGEEIGHTCINRGPLPVFCSNPW